MRPGTIALMIVLCLPMAAVVHVHTTAYGQVIINAYLDNQIIMQTIHEVERTGTLALCGYATTGLDLAFDDLTVPEYDYSEDWSGHTPGMGIPSGWMQTNGSASVWSIAETEGNRYLRLLKGGEPESFFRMIYAPGGVRPAWSPPFSLSLSLTPSNWGDQNQTFFMGIGGEDPTAFQAYKLEYFNQSKYLRLRDYSTNLCMYRMDWLPGTTCSLRLEVLPTDLPDVPDGALKFMTYNIHQAQMGDPAQSTYEQVLAILQAENADVIGLQETTATLTTALAQDLGYYSYFQQRMIFISEGAAILSRYPLLETASRNLPGRLLNPRIIIRAKINIRGREFQVFNTHYDHADEPARIDQANDTLNWISGYSAPVVLLGDFNARPNSTPYNLLHAVYQDANRRPDVSVGPQNTVSNPTPTVEIDHLFVSDDITVFKHYVSHVTGADEASDHRPVIALLGVGQRENVIRVEVNGRPLFSVMDTVLDDPKAYTQGSFVFVTSGGDQGEVEILVDRVRILSDEVAYEEDFSTVPAGALPEHWRMLYRTPGFSGIGEIIEEHGKRMWRQQSARYVKYDYAPRPYPRWQEYSFSAVVKTVTLPEGTKWRMNLYNYPMHDTAYNTYRIEVHANGNLYLRKGAMELASATWEEAGFDPFAWNTYEITTGSLSEVSGWNLY